MAGDGALVVIAGAFAGGIYAAYCLPECTLLQSVPILALPFLLSVCCSNPDRCIIPVTAVFFVLGIMRWNCEAFWSSGIQFCSRNHLAAVSLDRLTALIERAGFGKNGEEALITALLSGRRESLGRATVEIFRESGASHILALSGLHLGIIYMLLSRTLIPLGNSPAARAVRSIAVVCSCYFYTMMTGSSPSTVRALLFIIINEISKMESGRERSKAGIFSIAIIIQLLASPEVMLDTGFQLSYLAMAGLMTVQPVLESWYPSFDNPRASRFDIMHRIWSSASIAIACQAFTSPLVWFRFHTFPRHFLLTNIIALPLTETIMICAVITLVLTALGFCPDLAPELTGKMVRCLEYCLEIISQM